MRGRKKTANEPCFLCLTTSNSVKTGDGDGDDDINCIKNDIKILLQYLLPTRTSNYNQLIKQITKLNVGGDDGENLISIKFCETCRKSTKIIGSLHKSLELLQLKLIHQLKSINLKILNEIKTKSAPLEPFQNSPNLQKILPQFHQAILEKENLGGGIDIPFIFLEKYSPHTSTSTAPLQSAVIPEHPLIKNEAVDPFPNDDDLSDSHFDDLWNHADTKQEEIPNSDYDPPPIPKLKLKRKPPPPPKKPTPSPPKRIKRPTPKKGIPPKPKRPRGRPRLTPSNSPSTPKRKPRPKTKPPTPRLRRPLLCSLCPYKTNSSYPFKFEHHLLSHESPSPSSPPTTCPSCSKTFHFPQLLQFHMEGHSSSSPSPRTMLCDFCSLRVPYSEILPHMSTHLPPSQIFQCPNCSHCSSTRPNFLLHLKIHGKGRLPCDLCPLIFTLKCKLLEHLHKVHQVIQKLPCPFPHCPKSFYDPQHLKVHQNIHVNPYACKTCGKLFQDDYKLKVHSRSHTGEKPFKCEECPENEPVNFLSKACLIRHQIKKHGRSKYKCDYCDKEYGDRGMLRVHLTIHEGNGIPCGKCEKVLGSKTLWRRHQLVHSEKLEVICDECGKGFKCRYALKLHKESHKGEGEKGWICKVCGKAFVIKKYLMDHERTHTGERPFVCSVCGKAFSQHGSLCMHYKKFHPRKETEEEEEKRGKQLNGEQVVVKEDGKFK